MRRYFAAISFLFPLALTVSTAEHVLEADDDWLNPHTKDEIALEHGTVTLQCTVRDNDNSSLQWANPAQQTLYFDDKKALRDNRIELVNYSRRELTIKITNMTLNDEGVYTCSIFTMPIRTASANVVVLGVPKKPQITGYRGAVEEGRSLLLTCNTTGSKPAATIRWYKGPEELKGYLTHMEDSDDRTYSVTSQVNVTVRREDNGAEIICSLDHPSLDPHDKNTPQRIEVFYSPSVEIRASKAVPEEGEEFTLRCLGRGNPDPSLFLWSRLNVELSERAIPKSENLTFVYLNKSDAGTYRCEASNFIGTGSKNYSLTVHDQLSQLTQSSLDHAVIGGVVAVVVFIVLCLLIVLIRYLIRHKGTYLTHEAKGSDDAPDADTAIINAEGGHSSSEDKKEYFI